MEVPGPPQPTASPGGPAVQPGLWAADTHLREVCCLGRVTFSSWSVIALSLHPPPGLPEHVWYNDSHPPPWLWNGS